MCKIFEKKEFLLLYIIMSFFVLNILLYAYCLLLLLIYKFNPFLNIYFS